MGRMTSTERIPRTGRARLAPRWRKLLLTVHIVATVGWLGADLVLLALNVSGARGADPRTVYPAGYTLGVWVVAPLALLSLATGVAQGLLTPWGLLRHRWVTVKLVLTTVMVGLVFLLLLPKLAEMAEIAQAAVAARPGTAAGRTQLMVAPAVASVLLIINVVLSTHKPWGRLRR